MVGDDTSYKRTTIISMLSAISQCLFIVYLPENQDLNNDKRWILGRKSNLIRMIISYSLAIICDDTKE